MSKFTASNDVEITVEKDYSGDIYLTGKSGGCIVATGNMDGIKALREFFQHERDKELGRWRWPENPDYVVSLRDGGECVWVLNEREKGMLSFTREMSTPVGEEAAGYSGAAWAYFAAHPEPKPWHDAKPREVWVLTVEDTETAPFDVLENGLFNGLGKFGGQLNPTSENILEGKRIWPEDSNDS